MRIDLNSGAAISSSQVEQTSSSRHTQAGASTNTEQSHFSESESSVGKLVAAALTEPEVRGEKVQALQAQLASGNYHVSASQVANSIFEQVLARPR